MRVMALIVGILLTWVPGSMAKELQFPEIADWIKSTEIQTFIPKTLYEYINGAADLYLASDFEELKVAEYGNENKASVIVEAYRTMGSLIFTGKEGISGGPLICRMPVCDQYS